MYRPICLPNYYVISLLVMEQENAGEEPDDPEVVMDSDPDSPLGNDGNNEAVILGYDASVEPCKEEDIYSKEEADNDAKPESDAESDKEDQGCPICFEPWSNSGSHRLASLRCGHLFGRSCIERWLKGKATDKCPQCNTPAKRKDIRNIYCKALKVVDTSEKDRALKELEDEKLRRSEAEKENMRMRIKFEMARAELQRLKEQVKQTSFLQQQHQLVAAGERASSADSSCPSASQRSTEKVFLHQKTIQIAQSKARVMAFDKTHAMMAVSKPSPNQLFPGYGVVKVSSLEARSSEYVSIHQNTIRDVSFNTRGDRLLLSASMDKTVKITSMTSNTVVQSYNCSSPVWSCCWNDLNTNFMNAGLQNGQCLIFDIRKTVEPLKSFQAMNGLSCPVVSMAFVPKCNDSDFGAEGLLVCTLNGGCFWEICRDSQFVSHPLSLSPGTFSGIAFDNQSRHILASYRPSKFFSSTRHLIYKMSGQGLESSQDNPLCTCTQQNQLIGGSVSKVLSRASLFSVSDENDSLYAAIGDEASSSTLLWNCNTGVQLQKLPSTGVVLDVVAFSSNGGNFLSTLTDQRLSIYRCENLASDNQG